MQSVVIDLLYMPPPWGYSPVNINMQPSMPRASYSLTQNFTWYQSLSFLTDCAMSSSSSAQNNFLTALGFLPVSEKLTHSNWPLWRAQVLSSIRGAEVFEFITSGMAPPSKFLPKKKGEDDKVSAILNKEYSAWIAKDQQVLSYLLVSLSKEILL